MVLLLIGAGRAVAGAWLGFSPFDDTYITFRYAANLAAGHGLVYNLGESVLGTTSPLWAILIGLGGLAGFTAPMVAVGLSLCADVASALLAYRLLRLVGYPTFAATSAGLLMLAVFDYFSLARSGMETSLFVLLVLAALHSLASRSVHIAGVLMAAAVLVRPEGLLLPVLAVLWFRSDLEVPWRTRLQGMLVFLSVVGAWAIYAQTAYGSVIPQSIVAKAATSQDPELARFSWTNLALFLVSGQYGGGLYTRTYWQLSAVVAMLIVAAVGRLLADARLSPAGNRRAILLLTFPTGYLVGLALSHAFTFFPWYYGPLYPFAAVLAVTGASSLFRAKGPVILITATLVSAQMLAGVLVKLPNDTSYWVRGYQEVAKLIPHDPRLAVAAMEIGAVGFQVWPTRIIDLAGIVTPGAVGVLPYEFFKRREPDYLVLRTDDAAAFLRSAESDPWFTQNYALLARVIDPYVSRSFVAYRAIHRTASPE